MDSCAVVLPSNSTVPDSRFAAAARPSGAAALPPNIVRQLDIPYGIRIPPTQMCWLVCALSCSRNVGLIMVMVMVLNSAYTEHRSPTSLDATSSAAPAPCLDVWRGVTFRSLVQRPLCWPARLWYPWVMGGAAHGRLRYGIIKPSLALISSTLKFQFGTASVAGAGPRGGTSEGLQYCTGAFTTTHRPPDRHSDSRRRAWSRAGAASRESNGHMVMLMV